MEVRAIHPCDAIKAVLRDMTHWQTHDLASIGVPEVLKMEVSFRCKRNFNDQKFSNKLFKVALLYRNADADYTCVTLQPQSPSSATAILFREAQK